MICAQPPAHNLLSVLPRHLLLRVVTYNDWKTWLVCEKFFKSPKTVTQEVQFCPQPPVRRTWVESEGQSTIPNTRISVSLKQHGCLHTAPRVINVRQTKAGSGQDKDMTPSNYKKSLTLRQWQAMFVALFCATKNAIKMQRVNLHRRSALYTCCNAATADFPGLENQFQSIRSYKT